MKNRFHVYKIVTHTRSSIKQHESIPSTFRFTTKEEHRDCDDILYLLLHEVIVQTNRLQKTFEYLDKNTKIIKTESLCRLHEPVCSAVYTDVARFHSRKEKMNGKCRINPAHDHSRTNFPNVLQQLNWKEPKNVCDVMYDVVIEQENNTNASLHSYSLMLLLLAPCES